jgi:hypothetical protein
LVQNHLEDRVRFVTGTDCHDWSVYPSETPSEIIKDFPYTFAKCLPTFKGLVMAVTDYGRMKVVDSFFSATRYALPEIKCSYGGNDFSIPLSKGLNVIIGDNSVGKSLMLHALTGYAKPTSLLPAAVKNGYKKYLKEMNLSIPKQISKEHIFYFDMQGEVRSKFEENTLNRTAFLGQYFPEPIDNSPYKTLLENEISKMVNYLRRKFELDAKFKKLAVFNIEVNEENAESLTFVNNIGYGKKKSAPFVEISLRIESAITQIAAVTEMKLDVEDIPDVQSAMEWY